MSIRGTPGVDNDAPQRDGAGVRDEADSRADGVPLDRAHVPSRVFVFGPESEEILLEETLLAWQAQGPAAAWQAMFDLLGWWFEARGLDPEAQRIDRSHNETHRVPWRKSLEGRGHDA